MTNTDPSGRACFGPGRGLAGCLDHFVGALKAVGNIPSNVVNLPNRLTNLVISPFTNFRFAGLVPETYQPSNQDQREGMEAADAVMLIAPLAEAGAAKLTDVVGTSAKVAEAESADLGAIASEIRDAGVHPAARNQRVTAVGEDSQGRLFAGSSRGFDRGQRAAAEGRGVICVTCKQGAHAEENLMREVPDLKRVGTSKRPPCGLSEHNCAGQLSERGVETKDE